MRLKIWRRTASSARTGVHDESCEDIAQLYERDAARLRRRFGGRLCPDKAADIVQTIFVRLLGMGDARLRELDRPFAYLARAADNAARNDMSRAANRLHDDVDVAGLDLGAGDPHAALEARDHLRRIEAAIPSLPERTREIFLAHRFEGLTYAEIAERLEVSVKTVEKHISLALRALHSSIGVSP